jgi:cell division septation protein DedD
MGTRRHIDLTALLVASCLAGCASGPSGSSTARPADAGSKQPYDLRSEGEIPPASSNDAPVEADVEEMPISGGSLDVTDAVAPPPDTLRAPAVADSTAEGFRVQVFASSDREVANNAARVAEQRLGLRAYTVLDGGMYKVRVGDYLRRPDAEAAMATMRSHYYPDAWIVPARVRVPRKPANP